MRLSRLGSTQSLLFLQLVAPPKDKRRRRRQIEKKIKPQLFPRQKENEAAAEKSKNHREMSGRKWNKRGQKTQRGETKKGKKAYSLSLSLTDTNTLPLQFLFPLSPCFRDLFCVLLPAAAAEGQLCLSDAHGGKKKRDFSVGLPLRRPRDRLFPLFFAHFRMQFTPV